MANLKQKLLYVFFALFCFVLLYLLSLFMLNPAIDTGRELYIPLRMLNGEVLFKDIFNIYGSLSYQINSFAYSLMGAKINTLRIFGTLNFMLLLSAVWFILKELLPKIEQASFFSKFNLQLNVFTKFVVLTALSTGIFNYIFPYSFSMTYGLSFFLLSLLFFIKFSKTDMPKYAYLASLFSGGAISCKYDFLGYTIFLFLYILLCKKIETKNVLVSIILIVLIPLISYGLLFIQGVNTYDFLKTFQILKSMSQTDTLKYLYTNYTGTYFSWKIFTLCFSKTLILFLVGAILFLKQMFYKNDKMLTLIVFGFAAIVIWYIGLIGFSLFAMINALLFFLYFKKIYQIKPVFIFMLSTILLSLKTFFAVDIETYGIYTLPFVIISLFVFLMNVNYSNKIETKINLFNTYSVIVFILLCIFVLNSGINILKKCAGFINTEPLDKSAYHELLTKRIYTYQNIAKPINQAIDYINKNTKTTDKIVVLPETQFLNFVTDRNADNLYDSLTPMYFETFGEENIIDHFRKTMPEYFILNNRDTSDYGKRYICVDYGQDFCSFVSENYEKVENFGEKRYILQVFKRKDLL